MRPRSLTLRLTLHFGVVSAIVLVSIGWLVGVAVERHFVDLDRIELTGKMELVRHVVGKIRTPADLASLRERMDDALTGHPSLGVRIAMPEGRVLFTSANAMLSSALATSPAAAAKPDADIVSWMDAGHEFRAIAGSARTDMPDVPVLDVQVAVATDEHHRFMVVLSRTLWLAIAAGIASTAALGWFAARRGLAPVREMARVAHRVTASRLDDRLPLAPLPVELHELARAFNEMLSRLEDSFRRLTEFSSDLAHELRTPIANLVTQTQVTLARARSADEYREVLYSNSEELDRLTRMIADMLFLAKADHGLIVPRSEPVDLASEVGDLFEFYDALAEDRGVGMRLQGKGSVTGDRLMIRRAIGNLLANALNHTPKGGVIEVAIGSDDAGATRLTVANPGEAIPAAHLPRIFDRFYRIDSSRKRSTEGAGLGLAITRSIVAAHGGVVGVESAAGHTRFRVTFPATAHA